MERDTIGQFTYTYLVTVNLFTCGVELCVSAAFSYLPPMLLETGFSETWMSIIMATGPLLALFVLPCVGTTSDQCTSRYGRRKPIIFLVILCIVLALILLPNGILLGERLNTWIPGRHVGLAIVAFSVILLDFGSQIALMPIESLLSDQSKTEDQLNKAYSVFNFMLSLGSCFGYFVLCMDWNKTYLSQVLGGQEHMLFAILLILFLVTAVPSLIIAKDKPLSIQTTDPPQDAHPHGKQNGISTTLNGNPPNNSLLSEEIPPKLLPTTPSSIHLSMPVVRTISRPSLPTQIMYQIINIPITFVCGLFYYLVPKSYKLYLADTIQSVRTMPAVLRKLCLVNLLTCMAVIGFRMYFTDYVGEAMYHGNPESPVNSLPRKLYEEGIRMASVGLLFQSITSALFSFVLNHLIISYGPIATYFFGMVTFTLMTALMLVVEDISMTMLLVAFTGFASATTNSLPFTLLSAYHQKKEMYYTDVELQDFRLHGIGSNIALLDSAYVLSEVLSSFLFGMAVEFTGTTSSYIFCSCLCGVFSCYFILQLKS
ncbi:solute carrier family 45 member 3-like [Asterias amurensis]|uniref:solute carrier family 45 member 3-like n=1 Tax=Asterias amurensis TaxID=7602 RepID=UPI003AB4B279